MSNLVRTPAPRPRLPNTPPATHRQAQQPNSSTPASQQPAQAVAGPSTLLEDCRALLKCPCCDPPRVLVAPMTLHCAHTICGIHVTSPRSASSPSSPSSSRSVSGLPIVPSCPLPTCIASPNSAAVRPNIPIASRVAYFPPQAAPAHLAPPTHRILVKTPRLDITVARVMDILDNAHRRPRGTENSSEFAPRHSGSSDDESDDETTHHLQLDDTGSTTLPIEPKMIDSSSDFLTTGPSRRTFSARGSPPSARQRPPKRPRRRSATHSNSVSVSSGARNPPDPVNAEDEDTRLFKDLLETLTCDLCFMLLFQPVTTPCQHTFCAKCLQRSLDHNNKCPLCRQDLPPFSYFQDHPYNQVLLSIILKAFPTAYEERGAAIRDEERDARLNTPIFVCQLSFPGMPTVLNFFEPRYRLMLRRCLESPNPSFGMILPPREASRHGPSSSPSTNHDFGTMLEIRSVQMLPDGRSMVETIGSHRFRILERGTLDGYMVGRIERIDDVDPEMEAQTARLVALGASAAPSSTSKPSGNGNSSRTADIVEASSSSNGVVSTALSSSAPRSSSPPTLEPSLSFSVPFRRRPSCDRPLEPTYEELTAICHAFVEQLRSGTPPWVVQRLNHTYGPMPADPATFSFWMALLLPIDEHEKAKLLPIKSPQLRLRLVVHWIEQFQNNWWFSSGCYIC